jgi:hypothetical protein
VKDSCHGVDLFENKIISVVFCIITEIREIVRGGKGIIQAQKDTSLGTIGIGFQLVVVFLKTSEIRNGLRS